MSQGVSVIDQWVDGIPKAQPRPRAFARQTSHGPVARVYDAGTAEGWKGCIAAALAPRRSLPPLEGPVRLSVMFVLPRPKRMNAKRFPDGLIEHTAKPDLDNLIKAVKDCLSQLGVWHDDAQVCRYGDVGKFYADKQGRCGARIIVDRIAAPPPVAEFPHPQPSEAP